MAWVDVSGGWIRLDGGWGAVIIMILNMILSIMMRISMSMSMSMSEEDYFICVATNWALHKMLVIQAALPQHNPYYIPNLTATTTNLHPKQLQCPPPCLHLIVHALCPAIGHHLWLLSKNLTTWMWSHPLCPLMPFHALWYGNVLTGNLGWCRWCQDKCRKLMLVLALSGLLEDSGAGSRISRLWSPCTLRKQI